MIISDTVCISLIERLSEEYILTYNKYKKLLTVREYEGRGRLYMANGINLNHCVHNLIAKYDNIAEKVNYRCI